MKFIVLDTNDRVMGQVDLGGSLWRQATGTNRFDSVNEIDVTIERGGTVAGAEIRTGNQVIKGPLNCSGSRVDTGSTLRMQPGQLNLSFNERFEWDRLPEPTNLSQRALIGQVLKKMPTEDVLVEEVLAATRGVKDAREIIRVAIRMTREAMADV